MSFEGFPRELIEYLTELGKNNYREWFEAHRGDYETHLLEPAREFVSAMGECLKTLGSDIHAEARVRGSIFAINRDTHRNAVLDPVQGEKLAAVGEQLNGQGVQVAGQAYKKVPNGLPADHPRAEWLRYGALFAAIEQPVPKEIFSDQLPRVCERQFQRVAPLQQWLVDQLAD